MKGDNRTDTVRVMRVYTIWPADREGFPAASSGAWRQQTRWLVLDVTDGLDAAHVVEGPVSRATALRRELEIRVVARQATKDAEVTKEIVGQIAKEIR